MTAEAYVDSVDRAAINFVASDELVDRADLVRALCNLLGNDMGTLSLLVGPKDVGKSLILRSLPSKLVQKGRKVVVVSARTSGEESWAVLGYPGPTPV